MRIAVGPETGRPVGRDCAVRSDKTDSINSRQEGEPAGERRRRGSFGAAVPAPAAVLPPTTEALARAQAAGDEEQRLAGERRLWANIFIIGAALVGAALGVIAKDW